jgi:tRNA dimethylallyltransferase
MDDARVILLLGCTASGKSDAAMGLAARLNAEILCVDSMQVYRGMDIGTAKPSAADIRAVRHHLIDVAQPSEMFSVARFVELADKAMADMAARERRVIIVAGTPLYLMGLMYGMFDGPSANDSFRAELRARAAVEGTARLHGELAQVDPDAAQRIHPNDLKRIERALEVWHLTGRTLSEQQSQWSAGILRYPALVIGLRREKEDQSRRINARVHAMIESGLVEEVRGLFSKAPGPGEQALQALGYAEIAAHLRGEYSLSDAIEQIKINTRHFAKHQRTWFRKFTMTQWIDVSAQESNEEIVQRLMNLVEMPG